MKNFRFLISALVIALVLSACAQQRKAASNQEYFNRQWMLKTLRGVNSDLVLQSKGYINLTDITKTTGFAGCNRLFFNAVKGNNHTISFKNIVSTKMYCEQFMPVEQALMNALPQITSYNIEGHFIKFKDKTGNTLIEAVAADWD